MAHAAEIGSEINVGEIITAARRHGADTIAVTACETIGPEAVRRQASSEVAQYGAEARRRLLVRPGGLRQVSGRSKLT